MKQEDKEHKVELNFNYKPFSGHLSRLGHYFRHLFLIVTSIVYNDVVTEYKEQMRYLKILRAQLSNHEQIFLFYNWLSDYGGEWENFDNMFFTEYCMVHNLWYDELFENGFIKTYVDYLRDKSVVLRKGNMYEID
ncbi:MAG: putative phage abortive infection protein [Flavobacterium sp.]|nr:putative phage abortive infection protein [Flavobacterium sp.]